MGVPIPEIIVFLSTPSARRATSHPITKAVQRLYFYPRPPRGGRHMSLAIYDEVEKFLSTPSARRATCMIVL